MSPSATSLALDHGSWSDTGIVFIAQAQTSWFHSNKAKMGSLAYH